METPPIKILKWRHRANCYDPKSLRGQTYFKIHDLHFLKLWLQFLSNLDEIFTQYQQYMCAVLEIQILNILCKIQLLWINIIFRVFIKKNKKWWREKFSRINMSCYHLILCSTASTHISLCYELGFRRYLHRKKSYWHFKKIYRKKIQKYV